MKTLHIALVTAAVLAATATGLSVPSIASAQARLDTRAVVNVDLGRGSDRGYDRGFNDRRGGGDFGLTSRINSLQTRIDMGLRTGQLSGREADRLDGRLSRIEDTKRHYENSGHGLDGREVASLNDSLDRLSADIHYQGHDGNRR